MYVCVCIFHLHKHSAAAPAAAVAVQVGSQGASDYTALVSLMSQEVHKALPGSQVSVDIPWSPYDIDGRSYDWLGLAAAADLLFVMMYDTQSQVQRGGGRGEQEGYIVTTSSRVSSPAEGSGRIAPVERKGRLLTA